MSLYDGWDPPGPGWTCATCGFVYDAVQGEAAADTIRWYGTRFRALLLSDEQNASDEDLRRRPAPEIWSALEYLCHARDALRIYEFRIDRALTDDRPTLPAMNRDQAAIDLKYNEQDPTIAVEELEVGAETLAARIEQLPATAWNRAIVREGETLTIDWMTRNAAHEAQHQLLDVKDVLQRVTSGPAS